MYCSHCGSEIHDEAIVCIHCGCAVERAKNKPVATEDNGGTGWWLIGFFLPIVGLFMYLFFLGNRPKSAKMAGSGALIGLFGLPLAAFPIITIIVFSGSLPYLAALLMLVIWIASIVAIVNSAKGVPGMIVSLVFLWIAGVIMLVMGYFGFLYSGIAESLIAVAATIGAVVYMITKITKRNKQ